MASIHLRPIQAGLTDFSDNRGIANPPPASFDSETESAKSE
jgi:hypothetical protein